MGNFVLVGFGGAVGAVLRYAIGTQVQEWFKPTSFPLGTLLVNLSGCFLIGLVFVSLSERGLLGAHSLLLITGILGGYTTFSSFGLELFHLLNAGQLGHAALYFTLTNLAGLLAVWAGTSLAQRAF
ncbi:MAG: fluoride efflux transporter CrcB [Anaerolineales bacterium]|nr:MAG: fluoride efflux transporter CrcB [Anaerolineales bacterium]